MRWRSIKPYKSVASLMKLERYAGIVKVLALETKGTIIEYTERRRRECPRCEKRWKRVDMSISIGADISPLSGESTRGGNVPISKQARPLIVKYFLLILELLETT